MFYHSETNQYIREGTSFEINGTSYPANWLNCTTPDEKAAAGLVEVITTNQAADDRFYWVQQNISGATISYTNTPKDLAMLKDTWTKQIKSIAYMTLQTTDYMDSRKANDPSYNAPSAWISWRANVRSTASNTIAAIANTANVETLITTINVQWPENPDMVAEKLKAEQTANTGS